MPRRRIDIAVRNRRRPSPARPRTGTTPVITSVVPVGVGNPSQVTITFDVPVIMPAVPSWSTTGLSPDLTATAIVSKTATGMSVVLDFGGDVTGLTGISVPQGDNAALSESGKAVPPGAYSV